MELLIIRWKEISGSTYLVDERDQSCRGYPGLSTLRIKIAPESYESGQLSGEEKLPIYKKKDQLG